MLKREKIIVSALHLFAKNGFSETSVDAIAKHANVSKGLTYSHFKNKEDLLRVVIESTITEMTAKMMQIEDHSISSLLQNLKTSLIKDKEIIRLSILLLIHPQTPASVTAMLNKQKLELIELLSSLLEVKFNDKARIESELLLATIDGITMDYVLNPDIENFEDKIDHIINRYES
ncbi:TetR/AcrR family transcriptional regulator [Cyclobacterium sp. SYSU L10401]|uniref:TetR/AcrR family transcriptional regulator n=1 Tax=Cyclobacterium sp. SYSU L10401 TaxID=2678657 RepID=UPI0013D17560|nr:TetR/AcrR family transcriptional regulator [Cyclobacterium sp. SYSU L10401]